MMYSMVVLCILGVMFNQLVDACSPNLIMNEPIVEVNRTLINVSQYITKLKVNYEMKLLTMKINKTANISGNMHLLLHNVFNEMAKSRNMSLQDIESCEGMIIPNYTRAVLTIDEQMRKCVDDNINILEPVEKNIADFVNDMKSCLVHLNFWVEFMCLHNFSKELEECIAMMRYIDSATLLPITCNYNEYITKQRYLEDNASTLEKLGVEHADLCMHEIERNLNTTLEATFKNGFRCVQSL